MSYLDSFADMYDHDILPDGLAYPPDWMKLIYLAGKQPTVDVECMDADMPAFSIFSSTIGDTLL